MPPEVASANGFRLAATDRRPEPLRERIARLYRASETTTVQGLLDMGRYQEVRLAPGETYSVRPQRPQLVTKGGKAAATFLTLQGIGEYDFVPLR